MLQADRSHDFLTSFFGNLLRTASFKRAKSACHVPDVAIRSRLLLNDQCHRPLGHYITDLMVRQHYHHALPEGALKVPVQLYLDLDVHWL